MPQSSSGRYHYGRLQLLRDSVGWYRETNLDAGAAPAGWKAGALSGRLLLTLCPVPATEAASSITLLDLDHPKRSVQGV